MRLAILALGLAMVSPLHAADLGFEAGQLEINVQQAAAKLGGRFTMTAEKRACGDGIRCNWDLDGGVVAWADTAEKGTAVVSAGIGMNTDRKAYSASVSPRVFREACAALAGAAAPSLAADRIRKAVAAVTDVFREKAEVEVKEGRLVLTGERHIPSFKTKPDDAYYRCVVDVAD